SRGPDGPHRKMPSRRRDACNVGHDLHQLVERRHFPASEDVGAIGGTGHLTAQPKSFDEIVNVSEMVVDLTASEHREPPARDAAEQLEQTSIPGAVDAARAH